MEKFGDGVIVMAVLKKYMQVLFLLLLFICIYGGTAYAGDDDLMAMAATKSVKTFNAVKGIILIVGGFGLVGIAYHAIFGKMKWAWFACLAFGLALVSAASGIISYATGDAMDGLSEIEVVDTFGDEGGVSSGRSGGRKGGGFWSGFAEGFGTGLGIGYGTTAGGEFSASDARINM
ncbi:MAG: hypothetical protein IJ864_00685 [Alphaproteobacteria bacterium]|nr:hypothetical protein [Alphaproteobacteria bacterium]